MCDDFLAGLLRFPWFPVHLPLQRDPVQVMFTKLKANDLTCDVLKPLLSAKQGWIKSDELRNLEQSYHVSRRVV